MNCFDSPPSQGLLLMTLSVSVQSLRHHRAVFFTALYILSIGEGGHKPCVQTFAADQFDEDTVEEKKDKSSFFNWWYVGIVVGSTTAILVVIYVQDNVGWGLGFGMLAAAVAAALLLFLIGIRSYRRQRPVGSPLTRVMQVLVATARKLRVNETRYGRGVCLEDEGDDGVEEGGRRGRSLAPTNQFRYVSFLLGNHLGRHLVWFSIHAFKRSTTEKEQNKITERS